jgi:hypothetical protein
MANAHTTHPSPQQLAGYGLAVVSCEI